MKRIEYTGVMCACNMGQDVKGAPDWTLVLQDHDDNGTCDELGIYGLTVSRVVGLRLGARYRVTIEEVE